MVKWEPTRGDRLENRTGTRGVVPDDAERIRQQESGLGGLTGFKTQGAGFGFNPVNPTRLTRGNGAVFENMTPEDARFKYRMMVANQKLEVENMNSMFAPGRTAAPLRERVSGAKAPWGTGSRITNRPAVVTIKDVQQRKHGNRQVASVTRPISRSGRISPVLRRRGIQ